MSSKSFTTKQFSSGRLKIAQSADNYLLRTWEIPGSSRRGRCSWVSWWCHCRSWPSPLSGQGHARGEAQRRRLGTSERQNVKNWIKEISQRTVTYVLVIVTWQFWWKKRKTGLFFLGAPGTHLEWMWLVLCLVECSEDRLVKSKGDGGSHQG